MTIGKAIRSTRYPVPVCAKIVAALNVERIPVERDELKAGRVRGRMVRFVALEIGGPNFDSRGTD